MRLSVKHANQQTAEYMDFSGGLNTSNASEMISPNELSRAINVEIDKSTGLLRTTAGTRDVFTKEGVNFSDVWYDRLGDSFVICGKDKKIYCYKDSECKEIGTLTGGKTPNFALWEDGVLIASGGKLQYFKQGKVETMSNSPAECNGVFVKDGRVWTYCKDRIDVSGVGDENAWTSDVDDISSAQWLEVGYKNGGEIMGIVALSSDALVIKDNGYVFRVQGSFPNVTPSEVSREVTCKGNVPAVALVNDAIILGKNSVQDVSTTNNYGDMQANNIGVKVEGDIAALPEHTKLRYIPPLNQVWFITGDRRFLFLDIRTGGFFEREFNSPVMDVCYKGNEVYVLKQNKLQKLDETSTKDDGEPIRWYFKGKTLTAHYEYVVKRGVIEVTPLEGKPIDCRFWIGEAMIKARTIREGYVKPLQSNSVEVYGNLSEVYGNMTEVFALEVYRTTLRFIERLPAIKVECQGEDGQMMFNRIKFDYAEV